MPGSRAGCWPHLTSGGSVRSWRPAACSAPSRINVATASDDMHGFMWFEPGVWDRLLGGMGTVLSMRDRGSSAGHGGPSSRLRDRGWGGRSRVATVRSLVWCGHSLRSRGGRWSPRGSGPRWAGCPGRRRRSCVEDAGSVAGRVIHRAPHPVVGLCQPGRVLELLSETRRAAAACAAAPAWAVPDRDLVECLQQAWAGLAGHRSPDQRRRSPPPGLRRPSPTRRPQRRKPAPRPRSRPATVHRPTASRPDPARWRMLLSGVRSACPLVRGPSPARVG